MSFVTHHGPIFDGRAGAAARDFCDDWEREYAERTEDAVHNRLHQVLRHPTGNYERHIQTRKEGDGYTVDDSRIIYGPWLEGTGSRNAPKTRFKGYATFRLVTQRMQREANSYAESMLHQGYLGRMQ